MKKIILLICFTIVSFIMYGKVGPFNESTNPQDYLDGSFYNMAGFSYGYQNPDSKISLKNTNAIKANTIQGQSLVTAIQDGGNGACFVISSPLSKLTGSALDTKLNEVVDKYLKQEFFENSGKIKYTKPLNSSSIRKRRNALGYFMPNITSKINSLQTYSFDAKTINLLGNTKDVVLKPETKILKFNEYNPTFSNGSKIINFDIGSKGQAEAMENKYDEVFNTLIAEDYYIATNFDVYKNGKLIKTVALDPVKKAGLHIGQRDMKLSGFTNFGIDVDAWGYDAGKESIVLYQGVDPETTTVSVSQSGLPTTTTKSVINVTTTGISAGNFSTETSYQAVKTKIIETLKELLNDPYNDYKISLRGFSNAREKNSFPVPPELLVFFNKKDKDLYFATTSPSSPTSSFSITTNKDANIVLQTNVNNISSFVNSSKRISALEMSLIEVNNDSLLYDININNVNSNAGPNGEGKDFYPFSGFINDVTPDPTYAVPVLKSASSTLITPSNVGVFPISPEVTDSFRDSYGIMKESNKQDLGGTWIDWTNWQEYRNGFSFYSDRNNMGKFPNYDLDSYIVSFNNKYLIGNEFNQSIFTADIFYTATPPSFLSVHKKNDDLNSIIKYEFMNKVERKPGDRHKYAYYNGYADYFYITANQASAKVQSFNADNNSLILYMPFKVKAGYENTIKNMFLSLKNKNSFAQLILDIETKPGEVSISWVTDVQSSPTDVNNTHQYDLTLFETNICSINVQSIPKTNVTNLNVLSPAPNVLVVSGISSPEEYNAIRLFKTVVSLAPNGNHFRQDYPIFYQQLGSEIETLITKINDAGGKYKPQNLTTPGDLDQIFRGEKIWFFMNNLNELFTIDGVTYKYVHNDMLEPDVTHTTFASIKAQALSQGYTLTSGSIILGDTAQSLSSSDIKSVENVRKSVLGDGLISVSELYNILRNKNIPCSLNGNVISYPTSYNAGVISASYDSINKQAVFQLDPNLSKFNKDFHKANGLQEGDTSPFNSEEALLFYATIAHKKTITRSSGYDFIFKKLIKDEEAFDYNRTILNTVLNDNAGEFLDNHTLKGEMNLEYFNIMNILKEYREKTISPVAKLENIYLEKLTPNLDVNKIGGTNITGSSLLLYTFNLDLGNDKLNQVKKINEIGTYLKNNARFDNAYTDDTRTTYASLLYNDPKLTGFKSAIDTLTSGTAIKFIPDKDGNPSLYSEFYQVPNTNFFFRFININKELNSSTPTEELPAIVNNSYTYEREFKFARNLGVGNIFDKHIKMKVKTEYGLDSNGKLWVNPKLKYRLVGIMNHPISVIEPNPMKNFNLGEDETISLRSFKINSIEDVGKLGLTTMSPHLIASEIGATVASFMDFPFVTVNTGKNQYSEADEEYFEASLALNYFEKDNTLSINKYTLDLEPAPEMKRAGSEKVSFSGTVLSANNYNWKETPINVDDFTLIVKTKIDFSALNNYPLSGISVYFDNSDAGDGNGNWANFFQENDKNLGLSNSLYYALVGKDKSSKDSMTPLAQSLIELPSAMFLNITNGAQSTSLYSSTKKSKIDNSILSLFPGETTASISGAIPTIKQFPAIIFSEGNPLSFVKKPTIDFTKHLYSDIPEYKRIINLETFKGYSNSNVLFSYKTVLGGLELFVKDITISNTPMNIANGYFMGNVPVFEVGFGNLAIKGVTSSALIKVNSINEVYDEIKKNEPTLTQADFTIGIKESLLKSIRAHLESRVRTLAKEKAPNVVFISDIFNPYLNQEQTVNVTSNSALSLMGFAVKFDSINSFNKSFDPNITVITPQGISLYAPERQLSKKFTEELLKEKALNTKTQYLSFLELINQKEGGMISNRFETFNSAVNTSGTGLYVNELSLISDTIRIPVSYAEYNSLKIGDSFDISKIKPFIAGALNMVVLIGDKTTTSSSVITGSALIGTNKYINIGTYKISVDISSDTTGITSLSSEEVSIGSLFNSFYITYNISNNGTNINNITKKVNVIIDLVPTVIPKWENTSKIIKKNISPNGLKLTRDYKYQYFYVDNEDFFRTSVTSGAFSLYSFESVSGKTIPSGSSITDYKTTYGNSLERIREYPETSTGVLTKTLLEKANTPTGNTHLINPFVYTYLSDRHDKNENIPYYSYRIINNNQSDPELIVISPTTKITAGALNIKVSRITNGETNIPIVNGKGQIKLSKDDNSLVLKFNVKPNISNTETKSFDLFYSEIIKQNLELITTTGSIFTSTGITIPAQITTDGSIMPNTTDIDSFKSQYVGKVIYKEVDGSYSIVMEYPSLNTTFYNLMKMTTTTNASITYRTQFVSDIGVKQMLSDFIDLEIGYDINKVKSNIVVKDIIKQYQDTQTQTSVDIGTNYQFPHLTLNISSYKKYDSITNYSTTSIAITNGGSLEGYGYATQAEKVPVVYSWALYSIQNNTIKNPTLNNAGNYNKTSILIPSNVITSASINVNFINRNNLEDFGINKDKFTALFISPNGSIKRFINFGEKTNPQYEDYVSRFEENPNAVVKIPLQQIIEALGTNFSKSMKDIGTIRLVFYPSVKVRGQQQVITTDGKFKSKDIELGTYSLGSQFMDTYFKELTPTTFDIDLSFNELESNRELVVDKNEIIYNSEPKNSDVRDDSRLSNLDIKVTGFEGNDTQSAVYTNIAVKIGINTTTTGIQSISQAKQILENDGERRLSVGVLKSLKGNVATFSVNTITSNSTDLVLESAEIYRNGFPVLIDFKKSAEIAPNLKRETLNRSIKTVWNGVSKTLVIKYNQNKAIANFQNDANLVLKQNENIGIYSIENDLMVNNKDIITTMSAIENKGLLIKASLSPILNATGITYATNVDIKGVPYKAFYISSSNIGTKVATLGTVSLNIDEDIKFFDLLSSDDSISSEFNLYQVGQNVTPVAIMVSNPALGSGSVESISVAEFNFNKITDLAGYPLLDNITGLTPAGKFYVKIIPRRILSSGKMLEMSPLEVDFKETKKSDVNKKVTSFTTVLNNNNPYLNNPNIKAGIIPNTAGFKTKNLMTDLIIEHDTSVDLSNFNRETKNVTVSAITKLLNVSFNFADFGLVVPDPNLVEYKDGATTTKTSIEFDAFLNSSPNQAFTSTLTDTNITGIKNDANPVITLLSDNINTQFLMISKSESDFGSTNLLFNGLSKTGKLNNSIISIRPISETKMLSNGGYWSIGGDANKTANVAYGVGNNIKDISPFKYDNLNNEYKYNLIAGQTSLVLDKNNKYNVVNKNNKYTLLSGILQPTDIPDRVGTLSLSGEFYTISKVEGVFKKEHLVTELFENELIIPDMITEKVTANFDIYENAVINIEGINKEIFPIDEEYLLFLTSTESKTLDSINIVDYENYLKTVLLTRSMALEVIEKDGAGNVVGKSIKDTPVLIYSMVQEMANGQEKLNNSIAEIAVSLREERNREMESKISDIYKTIDSINDQRAWITTGLSVAQTITSAVVLLATGPAGTALNSLITNNVFGAINYAITGQGDFGVSVSVADILGAGSAGKEALKNLGLNIGVSAGVTLNQDTGYVGSRAGLELGVKLDPLNDNSAVLGGNIGWNSMSKQKWDITAKYSNGGSSSVTYDVNLTKLANAYQDIQKGNITPDVINLIIEEGLDTVKIVSGLIPSQTKSNSTDSAPSNNKFLGLFDIDFDAKQGLTLGLKQEFDQKSTKTTAKLGFKIQNYLTQVIMAQTAGDEDKNSESYKKMMDELNDPKNLFNWSIVAETTKNIMDNTKKSSLETQGSQKSTPDSPFYGKIGYTSYNELSLQAKYNLFEDKNSKIKDTLNLEFFQKGSSYSTLNLYNERVVADTLKYMSKDDINISTGINYNLKENKLGSYLQLDAFGYNLYNNKYLVENGKVIHKMDDISDPEYIKTLSKNLGNIAIKAKVDSDIKTKLNDKGFIKERSIEVLKKTTATNFIKDLFTDIIGPYTDMKNLNGEGLDIVSDYAKEDIRNALSKLDNSDKENMQNILLEKKLSTGQTVRETLKTYLNDNALNGILNKNAGFVIDETVMTNMHGDDKFKKSMSELASIQNILDILGLPIKIDDNKIITAGMVVQSKLHDSVIAGNSSTTAYFTNDSGKNITIKNPGDKNISEAIIVKNADGKEFILIPTKETTTTDSTIDIAINKQNTTASTLGISMNTKVFSSKIESYEITDDSVNFSEIGANGFVPTAVNIQIGTTGANSGDEGEPITMTTFNSLVSSGNVIPSDVNNSEKLIEYLQKSSEKMINDLKNNTKDALTKITDVKSTTTVNGATVINSGYTDDQINEYISAQAQVIRNNMQSLANIITKAGSQGLYNTGNDLSAILTEFAKNNANDEDLISLKNFGYISEGADKKYTFNAVAVTTVTNSITTEKGISVSLSKSDLGKQTNYSSRKAKTDFEKGIKGMSPSEIRDYAKKSGSLFGKEFSKIINGLSDSDILTKMDSIKKVTENLLTGSISAETWDNVANLGLSESNLKELLKGIQTASMGAADKTGTGSTKKIEDASIYSLGSINGLKKYPFILESLKKVLKENPSLDVKNGNKSLLNVSLGLAVNSSAIVNNHVNEYIKKLSNKNLSGISYGGSTIYMTSGMQSKFVDSFLNYNGTDSKILAIKAQLANGKGVDQGSLNYLIENSSAVLQELGFTGSTFNNIFEDGEWKNNDTKIGRPDQVIDLVCASIIKDSSGKRVTYEPYSSVKGRTNVKNASTDSNYMVIEGGTFTEKDTPPITIETEKYSVKATSTVIATPFDPTVIQPETKTESTPEIKIGDTKKHRATIADPIGKNGTNVSIYTFNSDRNIKYVNYTPGLPIIESVTSEHRFISAPTIESKIKMDSNGRVIYP